MSTNQTTSVKEALRLVKSRISSEKSDDVEGKEEFDIKKAAMLMANIREEKK